MTQPTFTSPDLAAFCRLTELGLTPVKQRLAPDHALIECRVTDPDNWCLACGSEGTPTGTIRRTLAHEPFGWRPTTLLLRIRRYRCQGCKRTWRQDTTRAAAPRQKISHRGIQWALAGIVCQHLTVARIAEGLRVSWNTANTAIIMAGLAQLIDQPGRLDGVTAIGVDEHVWRHTPYGDKYVTVIVDLTPVREKQGPARLLDMVEGRSKEALSGWLRARPEAWRAGIEVVAMDGFTGFKTAAQEHLPDAQTVMDPFHVVKLAGDALDDARRRVQQATLGRRGRKQDPLYQARRVLLTGKEFLTERQQARLDALFADERHADVHQLWKVYQQLLSAYRDQNRGYGRRRLRRLVDLIGRDVPARLAELRRLGHTLHKRRDDVLAYFDFPRTSNGPTEALNGRLEHLRGSALGFRNLAHYVARSLLEAGGFRPLLHPQL